MFLSDAELHVCFHAKAQRRKAKTQSYSLCAFITLASLREILCLTIIYLPKFANRFFLLLSFHTNSFQPVWIPLTSRGLPATFLLSFSTILISVFPFQEEEQRG